MTGIGCEIDNIELNNACIEKYEKSQFYNEIKEALEYIDKHGFYINGEFKIISNEKITTL